MTSVPKRRKKPSPPETPRQTVTRLKKLAADLNAASAEADVIAEKVREDLATALAAEADDAPKKTGSKKPRKK